MSQIDQNVPATQPGLAPPPGVMSNFINPYSDEDMIILTLALCLGFSTVLVWMRMYTKMFISRFTGWEDYTSVIAWLGLIGYCVIGAEGIGYGFGIHQWDVPLEKINRFKKLVNATEILYCPIIFTTKLSISLLYLRIFVPTHRGIRWHVTKGLIWINLLIYITVMFLSIFQCIPRRKMWNPSIPGHCISLGVCQSISASMNVFSDFAMLLLPIESIWHLQMATKRKLGVTAIFAVGTFACFSSIMRLITSVEVIHSEDLTYRLNEEYLWTVAEIASGLLCGCLPILPQFFRHFVPKVMSKYGTKGRRSKISAASSSGKPLASSGGVGDHPPLPQGNYIELEEQDKVGV